MNVNWNKVSNIFLSVITISTTYTGYTEINPILGIFFINKRLLFYNI